MTGATEEQALRLELAPYARLLVETGLLEFKGGNLSARIGDDEMLVTRRSSAKGAFTDDDVVRTSLSQLDDNANVASSTYEIHRAIYLQTDARAVIPAHPSQTVSLSLFLD